MKAIQFTIDERLLRRLDADPEVRKTGRSAFLRRAITDRLVRRRASEIRQAYRRGYGDSPVRAAGDDEFGPLEDIPWPDE